MICSLLVLSYLSLVLCSVAASPHHVSLPNNQIDAVDGDLTPDLRRALHRASLHSRDHSHSFQGNLSKALIDTTIFQWPLGVPDIKIVCKTCYFGGSVSGYLRSVGEGFNFTQLIDSVQQDVEEVVNSTWNQVEIWLEDEAKLEDEPFPDLHPDLNLGNIQGLPDAVAHFGFDSLELLLDLEMSFLNASTHTMTLFELPLIPFPIEGFHVGPVVALDLILVASSPLDIEGGIHLKIEDGLAFDMDLFKSMSKLSL
ncbi:hypothetical protein N7470_008281 [Penicillium chermesinum]|nr:hypothetical protein N7470_008281 [Penicillium chermesinum]